MGFLRLLLALSILSFHSETISPFLFNPNAAVKSFLIISGFYIALILDGKYNSIIKFYISRFLRIFPLYWTALFLTVSLGLAKTLLNLGSEENIITHYLTYSTHLHGQEALIEGINFILRNLTLIITKDYFGIHENQAAGFLIVNQSWTLQIELLFYILAPFILLLRRNFWAYVAIYYIAVYIVINPLGLFPNNSLTVNFVNYLIFFLLGICGYKYVYQQKIASKKYAVYILIAILTFIIFYPILPGQIIEGSFEKSLIFYLPFTAAISFIFTLTKDSKFDRYIGELSYPVYILHMIIVKMYFALNIPSMPYINTLTISILTLTCSVITTKLIQLPIDRIRHKLSKT